MLKTLKLAYFAGGSEFTLAPFLTLLESKHEIKIVYTKSPKLSGRGKKNNNNFLLNEGLKRNIEFKTLDNFHNIEYIKTLQSLELDFIIVFSFGIILPKEVLNIPKFGCINIHTSLLPKWRGASPVQHCLLNNDKETGYTLIIMNEELDKGKIISKEVISVEEEDNYKILLNKITKLASKNLVKILEGLASNKIKPTKQDEDEATYCYRIKKEDTYINFDKTAIEILGKIRAFSPFPGAKCYLQGELIKILEAKVENNNEINKNFGVVFDDNLLIACKTGFIRLTKIQREGRKAMHVKEVLNGWKVKKGSKINA